MKIVFLKAGIALTKTYSKASDGSIEKSSYPNVANFTSIVEDCPNLQSLETAMRKHAALGHTLLKGSLAKPLVDESRKGSTDTHGQTDYIVLDIDGLPGTASIDQVLKELGLGDISYIIQFSASYRIENNHLRAHIFMQLAKPMAAPLLKQWLMDLNHKVALLRDAMQLTKTGNSVTWPLDITACQNDKLIYIAPPLLKGGIKDPMNKKARITYVAKTKAKLDLTNVSIPTTEVNRERTHKRINELREKAGLPARKHVYKMVGSTNVLVKPDNATVSETKTDRGFVYFNLNGGDSWAYYHPEDNPDFIHNFKGEPSYLTKELLPEYWEQLTQNSTKINSAGLQYLVLLDRKTSKYYRGTYDRANDILDLHKADNETQVRHFAKQHGVPLGDYIPEWDLIFDPYITPGAISRVDEKARTVNVYEPTQYARKKPKKTHAVPPTIAKVIMHAIGNDVDVYEHFLNWLAVIVQFKIRTQTAWVLHGEEGSGKGTTMNRIIRPLLGAKYTAVKHMEELNERYTHFLENNFVLFIDEIEMRALDNEKSASSKIRNWTTEPTVTIRAMQTGSYDAPNYNNIIMASNKAEPVVISKGDRRHNIAIYQPVKLLLTEAEITRLESELQGFHDYLMTRVADKYAASQPIDTADRRALISLSMTSVDSAVTALLAGDMEFFIDQLPTTDQYKTNAVKMNRAQDYRDTLLRIIDRADRNTNIGNVSRDELHLIFGTAVGNVPDTPNKFTSMLKHHRVNLTKVWMDRPVMGMKITWQGDLATLREQVDPPAPPPEIKAKPTKLKVVKKG